MELVEAFVALLRKRGRAVTQEKYLWMKIMLQRIYKRLRSEKANTLIENVIILPLIIIVIYFMILASFVIHDHSTLDAAAKRGTIYAARCISDPNYPMILQQSGHQSGMLDTNVTQLNADSFNGVGDNIKPYRYLVMNTADIRDATVNEISNIIQHTKIPWREIETGDIAVKIDNKIIYQNVEVSITARYPLPKIFGNFGLPTEFNYTVTAATAVNDPDEFIRNVDLIIDVCAAIDRSTGGNIQKVLGKLNDMGTKLTQFLSGEKGFGGSGGAGAPAGGGGEGDHFAEAGDNDGEENGSGEGGTEAEGENGSGDFAGIGVGNGTGSVGNGGNVSTGGLGIVATPGGDENREDKEEVTPQHIRDSMITRFGQANVDAISEGVDTSTWTEDDWYIYMQEYLLNGSLPGDWIAPTSTPVPTPSSTPEPQTIPSTESDTDSKTVKELISECQAAEKWGTLEDGTNQGVKHFSDYWELYPDRIPSLEKRLGVSEGSFENSLEGFLNFTAQAERVINEATLAGNVREVNGKSIYYIEGADNPKKGVVVIVKEGKIQSMMPSRAYSKFMWKIISQAHPFCMSNDILPDVR